MAHNFGCCWSKKIVLKFRLMRSDDYQFSTLFLRYFKYRFIGMTNSDLNFYLDTGGCSQSLQFLQRRLHGFIKDATRQFNCCPAWNIFHHIKQNNLWVAAVGSSMLYQGIDLCNISQIDWNKNGFVQRDFSFNLLSLNNNPMSLCVYLLCLVNQFLNCF